LSAENLRNVDLHLSGSGLGSRTKDEMKMFFRKIVPEMLHWTADKKSVFEIEKVNLKDFEKFWDMDMTDGKRLVLTI
jgi:hypothetical protein